MQNLTAQERVSLGRNGAWISDNQLKVMSVALQSDFLVLDTPSSLARYVERGQGEVRYLTSDITCSCNMFATRRYDQADSLRIIKYTPGHYEGVCWV